MIYRILALSDWHEKEWKEAARRTALIDAVLGRSFSRAPQMVQREHQAAWWLATEMLEDAVACPVPPEAFMLCEHGKPALIGGEWAFSVSHTAGYVLCAIHTTAVGADIQVIRPVTPALIRRVCAPQECAYVGEDPARFAEVFSAKEAYVKYRGTGLSEGLRTVLVATETGLLSTVNGKMLWPIYGENYRGAVVFDA